MDMTQPRRKVLFLNDRPSIRNLLVLMGRIESEDESAAAGRPSLASLSPKQFDSVVLDLRITYPGPRQEVRGIGDIRAGWAGKLMVIILDVNGPKTLEMIERYLFKGLPTALVWLVSHRAQVPRRSAPLRAVPAGPVVAASPPSESHDPSPS
jgi:hypothetical protein